MNAPAARSAVPVPQANAAGGDPQREVGTLLFRPLDIDTWQEHVIYMHPDCAVCRAEGFSAQTRVHVQIGDNALIATLTLLGAPLLAAGEASLSLSASRILKARAGDVVRVTHAPALESVRSLRAKIYGSHLDGAQLDGIIDDISAGRYADVHIAAFLAACANERMTLRETVDLTRAMVKFGQRLHWDRDVVADKHCVGGLPGNRTTPIVVAIAAAAGLLMPKTSSRAITSPAGTADVMEALTCVTLDATEMRRVVEQVGAAIVWGGALSLSPADDVLIRVERALDIDSDAQLVASILSKKVAAGSTHVLIDVPVGKTAKIREDGKLARLHTAMTKVAEAFGLNLRIVPTDGSQPVGRGVGPALEALDVLAVLQCQPEAPAALRERSLLLAGELLEFCGGVPAGQGLLRAGHLLENGSAWGRFQAICEAQGGLRRPGQAVFRRDLVASRSGVVTAIDNRHVSRVAKLAGAPRRQVAGLELHVRVGEAVDAGAPLCTLHAQALGELDYAFSYALAHVPFLIE